MEINKKTGFQNIDWICKIGLLVILILPILVIPPWIDPPDWGKTIIFRCIFSVILFLLFYSLFYKQGYKLLEFLRTSNLKKNVVVWLLAALATLYLLSSIFSKDPLFSFFGSPLRGGGSLNFIFYIVFSIVIFLLFKESDWQKAWLLSIIIGVLASLIAVFQFYGLFKDIFTPFKGRPPSVIGGAIFLGTYLLLLSFITLFFLIKEKNKRTKIFYIISLILFLGVIMATGSRAAYFGLLIGFFYFFFFYSPKLISPKKRWLLILSKILTLVIITAVIYGVYYVNYGNKESKFFRYFENNQKVQGVLSRLSLKSAFADPRFSAWQVGLRAIKESPVLGWGPENFSIAFDKYYDPSLPYISKSWGGWWDKAHNVLLDTAVTTGVPAMLAYLSIFIVLFWQLQKSKAKEENRETQVIFHGIQATLIAYLADNFFTFDTFSSYIIFFLLVAYSLHLINKNRPFYGNDQLEKQANSSPKRKVVMVILFCFLVLFLWQYNVKPFLINAKINMAEYLVNNQECAPAFKKMEGVLSQHSFLDSFSRLQYVNFIKKCAETDPENSVAYTKKGIKLLSESVKIQPMYSRSWIFLGGFTTILANSEQDQVKKSELISQAESYLKKAAELAPSHQEIILEQAKIDMVRGDYQGMKEKAEKCISLDKGLGDCYWLRGLSEIYLKDFNQAQIDIEKATNGIFDATSISSIQQLANAYSASENYNELVLTYQNLIAKNPNVAQYHSSLAFTYAQLGQYKKARQEALLFLGLMPEAKDEVNSFLQTLPH